MNLDLKSQLESIDIFDEKRDLGARMKEYENLTRFKLSKEYPLIIRVDGNAFHTFTRGFNKPFDWVLSYTMSSVAAKLCKEIPHAVMAYTQSDEISILITPYKNEKSEPWFDNNINKLVSLTASIATRTFNKVYPEVVALDRCSEYTKGARERAISEGALFDSRAFILPMDEVTNYFIWRQQDAIKNAVSMAAQSMFSHKELHGLNSLDMTRKMFTEKGIDFETYYQSSFRRGTVIRRGEPTGDSIRAQWNIDLGIPVFTESKEFIEGFLQVEKC